MLRNAPIFLLLIAMAASLGAAAPLKILFYQIGFGNSHIRFSGALVDTLVEDGHTVDKLITGWLPIFKQNGTEKARRIIRIDSDYSPFAQFVYSEAMNPFNAKPDHELFFKPTREHFCDLILSNSELIAELRAEEYDIGVATLYDSCGLALFHALGIRSTVGYSASPPVLGNYETFGIPMPPSYVADTFFTLSQSVDFSFPSRVRNFIQYFTNFRRLDRVYEHETEVFRRHIPDCPSAYELNRRISFIFINSHELLEAPRPISGKIKYIGGIHMPTPTKKLPPMDEDFDRIMRNSPNGVVVFSLGTVANTKSVPPAVRRMFIEAFTQIPKVNFIWKHDNVEDDEPLLSNATNVFARKWIPQKQLLADSRVRLFITHMGMNSYMEVTLAGVPVIALPLIIDQNYVAMAAMDKGIGVMLDKFHISTAAIANAIREVLEKPSYAENAKTLSAMLAAHPHNSTKEFIDHVVFAANFPTATRLLELPAARQSLFVRHSLDVIAFLLFTVVVSIGLTIALFRRIAGIRGRRTPRRAGASNKPKRH